ncbi:LAMI_0H15632g1_1 [Lachancea mirantina]|uniref:LAMI_0H15632g1_1 n=1 Tax=Lachancea mirantina TaxID=1230905 RepID=A0A1G4KII2_9SACH|nr:LAMI_0H15632g1_1 [Lachancea mirantina]
MGQDDKENGVLNTVDVPTTPRHLLNRSHSYLKDKSPKKTGSRRPLASKDNNKTGSFLIRKNGMKQAGAKAGRPKVTHTGSFISGSGRGPGAVSAPVLNSKGAPRIKSLVLKDMQEEEAESPSDDDDDEQNPLTTRLKAALGRRREGDIDEEAQGGLLETRNGILKLLPDTKDADIDTDSDMEVETIPPRAPALPYEPDGYTRFTQTQIGNLQKDAPFSIRDEDSDGDSDGREFKLQLLPLDLDQDVSEEDSPKARPENDMAARGKRPAQIVFPLESTVIEPSYPGTGLSTEELEALLE